MNSAGPCLTEYDLAANSGWVSVGVDHDTAAFAVNSIRQCWRNVGRLRYPDAARLLITADGGGSNGWRVRLWKRKLQKTGQQARPRYRVLPPAARHQQAGARSSTGSSPSSAKTGALSPSSVPTDSLPSLPRSSGRREMLTFAHPTGSRAIKV
jgi:hypothetical protein